MKQISEAIFKVVKGMPTKDMEIELRNNALHHAKDNPEAEEIFAEVKKALVANVQQEKEKLYETLKGLDNQKKELEAMGFNIEN